MGSPHQPGAKTNRVVGQDSVSQNLSIEAQPSTQSLPDISNRIGSGLPAPTPHFSAANATDSSNNGQSPKLNSSTDTTAITSANLPSIAPTRLPREQQQLDHQDSPVSQIRRARNIPTAIPIAKTGNLPPATVTIQIEPTESQPFELGDLLSRKWVSRNIGIVTSLLIHISVLLFLSMFLITIGTGKVMVVLEMITGPEMENVEGTETKFELEFGDESEDNELDEAENESLLDAIGEFNDTGQAISPLGEVATSGSQNSGGGDGKSAKFFGMRSTGNSFVFVLDCSGSMSSTKGLPALDGTNRNNLLISRFDVARAELMHSIENLQPHQEFYAVLFSAKMHRMFGDRSALAKPIKATRENKDRFREWLDRRGIDGGTDPRASMKLALRIKPDSIFMLSDGEFIEERGRNKRKTVDIAKSFFDENELIKINAIAFEDERSKSNMQELAEASGGQFKFVKIKDSVGSLSESPDEKIRMRAIEHRLADPSLTWDARKRLIQEQLLPLVRSEFKTTQTLATSLLDRGTYHAFSNEIDTVKNESASKQSFIDSIDQWQKLIEQADQSYPIRISPFEELNFTLAESPVYLASRVSFSEKEMRYYFQQVNVKKLPVSDLLRFTDRLAHFRWTRHHHKTVDLLKRAFRQLNAPTGELLKLTDDNIRSQPESLLNRILRNREQAATLAIAKLEEESFKPLSIDEHTEYESKIVAVYPETSAVKKLILKSSLESPVSKSSNVQ
jgi:hypothetical protein